MTTPRVLPPIWLNTPRTALLRCRVTIGHDSDERTVDILVNGSTYTAIVPANVVTTEREPSKEEQIDGTIKVWIIAEIPDSDRQLAELPVAPINGSQRIEVKAEDLAE